MPDNSDKSAFKYAGEQCEHKCSRDAHTHHNSLPQGQETYMFLAAWTFKCHFYSQLALTHLKNAKS